MRVSFHRLDDIRHAEHNREYNKQIHITEDFNRHLNRKSRHEHNLYIDLYNKKADLKRYVDRTTIDVFV
jgi:hypothetical protein